MRKTVKVMRDIEDLNKWKDTPCFWRGRLNIVLVLVLHYLIYRVSEIPIKSQQVIL